MRKYVLKRILQIILTLFIYLTIIFVILEAQPGDITDIFIMNPKVTPEIREALRHQLGLDQPLHIRYFDYLRNFITGNLGLSFSNYPKPVWDIIKERLPRTVVLFLTAYCIYFFLGFQLGKIIAWRRGAFIEYAATITGVILWTVFTPWFALLIIWALGYKLGWFPMGKFLDPMKWILLPEEYQGLSTNTVFNTILLVAGIALVFLFAVYLLSRRFHIRSAKMTTNLVALAFVGISVGWLLSSTTVGYLAGDMIWHMVLPVFTLTCIGFGGYMLMMRTSMLETVREDYVMAAKAKGLPDKAVRDKHAARNALLPIVTSFILAIAFTVDGGVITETVFSWRGMGWTLLHAVLDEDMPLAVGALVFTGIFALIAHLVADLMYAFLDPRIRYD